MKKNIALFLSSFSIAVFLMLIYSGKQNDSVSYIKDTKPETGISELENFTSQHINLIHAPENVAFAGEKLPLEYFDVRESLERELNAMTYGHNLTILTLRLTKRYFSIIEPILAAQNVPDDFKYLCVAESNLQNLVSPAKASGMWQFLNATGKEYGLEINDEVDERYHLEKATIAACKYLKTAYQKFGNWTLAAASYNTGMGNINKAINTQDTHSYYDMLLHPETSRYIYRIVSYKIILENIERYGFYIPENKHFKPFEYSEIEISEPIENLAEFAKKHGTNFKMLKTLNPWLRKTSLTNKGAKTYTIKIPTKDFRIYKP